MGARPLTALTVIAADLGWVLLHRDGISRPGGSGSFRPWSCSSPGDGCVIQRTQARGQAATQRKLDGILLAPPADDSLLMLDTLPATNCAPPATRIVKSARMLSMRNPVQPIERAVRQELPLCAWLTRINEQSDGLSKRHETYESRSHERRYGSEQGRRARSRRKDLHSVNAAPKLTPRRRFGSRALAGKPIGDLVEGLHQGQAGRLVVIWCAPSPLGARVNLRVRAAPAG